MFGKGQWTSEEARTKARKEQVANEVEPKKRLIILGLVVVATIVATGLAYDPDTKANAYIVGGIGVLIAMAIVLKLITDLGFSWMASGMTGWQRQVWGYVGLACVVLYVVLTRIFRLAAVSSSPHQHHAPFDSIAPSGSGHCASGE